MSEVIQKNAEEVQEIAESKGLVCILPTDYEIQVDDDGYIKDELDREQVLVALSMNGIDMSDLLITKSEGGNRHLYYRCNLLFSPEAKLVLQLALGSDPVREVLSLLRIREGSTAPTALFETQEEAVRVNKWRTDFETIQSDDCDIPY